MSLKVAQTKAAAIDAAKAAPVIVKPQAAVATGTTDTATGGTLPAPVPIVTVGKDALPTAAETAAKTATPLVQTAVQNAINAPIRKPQAIQQGGTTDTATGGTLPIDPNAKIYENPIDAILNTKTTMDNTRTSEDMLKNKQATSPTSGGSTSGGGSGGGGSTATTPTTPVAAPTIPNTAPIVDKTTDTTPKTEVPVKEQNVYFDTLLNTKFDYNPATDSGYLQARATAENGIIQAIIGRGGIYSSVARNAVAAKLTDLAIEYEKVAYQKYTDERAYMFQLAQFEQDRINTAWTQNFQENQFEAEQDQIRFTNALNLAEFQFKQEQEAFDQRMTVAAQQASAQRSYSSSGISSAKATLEAQELDIVARLQQNSLAISQVKEMKTRWANNNGEANASVAAYFAAYGVQVGDSYSEFSDVIYGIETKLTDEAYTLGQEAITLGEGKAGLGFVEDTASKETAPAGSTEETATADQRNSYFQVYNQAMHGTQTKATLEKKINSFSSFGGSSQLRSTMGSYYYNRLMENLIAAKNSAE